MTETRKTEPVYRGKDRIRHLVMRNGVYYLRAQVAGKSFLRASPYADLLSSEKWANKMIARARERRGDSLAETKARSEYVTLAEFVKAYRAAAAEQFLLDGKPSERTARRSATSLLWLVRSVHGGDPDKVRLDVITPALADAFVKGKVTAAGHDELKVQRARISAAAGLRRARACFARWTLAYYQRAGINLPASVTAFMATGKASFRPPPYQARPAALVAKTHEEAAKLPDKAPGTWAAYLLCYRLGLRAGEATDARWTWIEGTGAARVLHICKRPDWKGAKNTVDHSIPATAETWDALEQVRGTSPYILPGANRNQRYNVVTRDLADWMRKVGWDRTTYPKAAHELRKLAGGKWLETAGLAWASKWLGDSPVTVSHYYASALGNGKAVEM